MHTQLFHRLAPLAVLVLAASASAKQPPASDDRAIAPLGQSILIDALANDTALGTGLRLLKAYKPAHGTVSIENNRVRYTPSPGFEGSDTFRYKVQADNSQPAEATVNVEVGQGGAVVRLVGQVVDEPIPNATVTVSIGGFDFVTQADANGNYVLDIAALQGDAFVTLAAVGTAPSGATVRFYSVVGEIARLATAAGSDGVLVRDEFNQVNVTNLSTAQFTLLSAANGGTPVATDQQLLQLAQNINLEQLLELAAIIKLVVDDNVPLPAGTTDALALISDPAAVEAFKAGLAPNQLTDAVAAVASDPAVTPAFRAGAVPAGYAMISPSAPGTIRAGLVNGILARFDNSAAATSGSGSSIDYSADSTPEMTWQLLDGDLVITPVAPFTTPWYLTQGQPDPSCDLQYWERNTQLSYRLRRLQDGPGMDYLNVTESYNVEYRDDITSDSCVPPANGVVDVSFTRLGFEDGLGELAFTANEVLGWIALNHAQPGVYPTSNFFGNWAAAVFDFSTHTVDIPGTVSAFTSTVSNGRQYVQLTDSATQEVTQYEYRRYQMDGNRGEGILTIVTQPDGRQISLYSLASRQNDGASFANLSLPARWRSGFDASQFQSDGSLKIGFSLILNNDAAQTGIYDSVDSNGVGTLFAPFTWNVEADNMVARSYRNPPYGAQPSCSVPMVGTGCWLKRTRTWTPLSFSADGSRVYVLERIYDRTNASQPLNLIAERVNFYNRE